MKLSPSDFGDLRKTSSVCPFCNRTFKVLGKHLLYCKERKGRPYAAVLAVSSGSQRKATTPMASHPVQSLCLHCDQSFSRLDLHLHRNVSCSKKANKTFVSAESQQQPHRGQITDTWSYNTFQTVKFEQGESPALHLKPAISLPNCQQKHEWFEVNQHIEVHTAPRVYAANTVEEKKATLSEDLYNHLAHKFGTVPPSTKKLWRKPLNRISKKVRDEEKAETRFSKCKKGTHRKKN